MKIVNFTIDFEERLKEQSPNLLTQWNSYEEDYVWYGILKMNDISIFETPVNYLYNDEDQMSEQVIYRFTEHIKPQKETILK